MPHSGMPGPPCGPAFFSTRIWSGRDVEIVALDLARHVVVVLERDHLAAMLAQALLGGGRLHHAAARREIAFQHRGRAAGIDRIGERVNRRPADELLAPAMFSPTVLPVTVMQDRSSRSRSSVISARMPPA